MDEFTTNPGAWAIGGNIVGTDLGILDDTGVFTNTNSVPATDGTEAIGDFTLNIMKFTYTA